ncbi:hypothetical protein [Clostridium sp. HBUAS56017]|uniref:hypothetical protein n=1 Tax=Clostridium sp. HBUAS56017 TaxID=2571128 RepID=UPI001178BE60|nr:hypothetical protein [Clostridium sp. HBUAS56017]
MKRKNKIIFFGIISVGILSFIIYGYVDNYRIVKYFNSRFNEFTVESVSGLGENKKIKVKINGDRGYQEAMLFTSLENYNLKEKGIKEIMFIKDTEIYEVDVDNFNNE